MLTSELPPRAALSGALVCACVCALACSLPRLAAAQEAPPPPPVSDVEGRCLEDHVAHEAALDAYGPKPSDVDCSERQDTGYRDGRAFTITVVTVDGEPVERETANAYWVMRQAAAADGVNIRISSGFRTQAEQQYFYDCYRNCNCNSCNLAARPGYSNHQSGHALDLNTSASGVLRWLNSNGARFGFTRTVPSEDWHWEWWGGGPGGGGARSPSVSRCPRRAGAWTTRAPALNSTAPSTTGAP